MISSKKRRSRSNVSFFSLIFQELVIAEGLKTKKVRTSQMCESGGEPLGALIALDLALDVLYALCYVVYISVYMFS